MRIFFMVFGCMDLLASCAIAVLVVLGLLEESIEDPESIVVLDGTDGPTSIHTTFDSSLAIAPLSLAFLLFGSGVLLLSQSIRERRKPQ